MNRSTCSPALLITKPVALSLFLSLLKLPSIYPLFEVYNSGV